MSSFGRESNWVFGIAGIVVLGASLQLRLVSRDDQDHLEWNQNYLE